MKFNQANKQNTVFSWLMSKQMILLHHGRAKYILGDERNPVGQTDGRGWFFLSVFMVRSMMEVWHRSTAVQLRPRLLGISFMFFRLLCLCSERSTRWPIHSTTYLANGPGPCTWQTNRVNGNEAHFHDEWPRLGSAGSLTLVNGVE